MADLFRLDGKIAVIIGGAGGLGESVALGIARQGAKVVVASRNLSRCKEVALNISADPAVTSETAAFQVDVTDNDNVAQLVARITAEVGVPDILINAQGINIKKASTEFPMADWDRMFDVNVKGTMITCKEFGKVMIEKNRGKIINFSSVRGIRGTAGGNTGYGATKGAVDMITRMLAAEWAPNNINVNAIGPAIIMTEGLAKAADPARLEIIKAKIPFKRMGTAEDIVGACIFLSAPASDFITGQIIYIDGGLTAVA